MKMPPPMRFLGGVLGGWICFRAAMLVPDWVTEPQAEAASHSQPSAVDRAPVAVALPRPLPHMMPAAAAWKPSPRSWPMASPQPTPKARRPHEAPITLAAAPVSAALSPQLSTSPHAEVPSLPGPLPQPLQRLAQASRWSLSTWALVRRGETPSLAAGGMLGGSQAGARLLYRINGDPARPLSLSARLYSPLRDRQGAEAAIGLEWQPLADVPVRVLAERRQVIGSGGRSAFALLAHGGVSAMPVGPLRLEGYAQAGVVGLRSRDLFVDGGATLGLPIGERITLGGGLWGAAQPGLSRLDAGPSVSLSIPLEGRNLRISADWRLRVAGDAFPTSGPALTLGSDF